MGLGQWILIVILLAIIFFGFAAVLNFATGIFQKVFPQSDHILYEKVTRVIDGDTIELNNGKYIVRMALVNTPERGEYGWSAAKEWTEYRCLNQMAVVDIDDKQLSGTYNRVVGLVWCSDYFVNLELVSLDLAKVEKHYCKMSEFKDSVICLNLY